MLKEDSFRVLVYVYFKGITNSKTLIAETGWNRERIKNAIEFLEREDLIDKAGRRLSGDIVNIRCSPYGRIKIEESKNEENVKEDFFGTKYNLTINFNVEVDSIFKTDKIFSLF